MILSVSRFEIALNEFNVFPTLGTFPLRYLFNSFVTNVPVLYTLKNI